MRVLLFCLLAWLCGVRADDGADETRGLPRVRAKAKPRALPRANPYTRNDGPNNGVGSGQLPALMPEANIIAMLQKIPSTLGNGGGSDQQQTLTPKFKAKAKAKPRALPREIGTSNVNNVGNNQLQPVTPSSAASSTTTTNSASSTQLPKIKPKPKAKPNRRAKTNVTSAAKIPTTITATWSVHQAVDSSAPINAVDIPCPGITHSFTHSLLLTHSLTVTHSLTHYYSLTYSLTHSLVVNDKPCDRR